MQSKSYNTRAIVEAGLITALIIVMMMLCIYVPVFSMLTNFILPIPISILYVRQNYKVTLISVAASGIFIAIMYNPITSLSSIVLIGLSGIALGYCIKNKKNFAYTITILTVAIFIGEIIYILVYTLLINNNGIYGFVNDNIVRPFKESLDINKNIYSKIGVPSEQLKSIEDMSLLITPDYILKLIPAVILLTSIFMSYINYLIGKTIFKKLNYQVPIAKPFNRMYINTRIGTLFGVILLIGVILDRQSITVGGYFISFSGIMLQFIFLVNGLSLTTYYLKNKFGLSNKLIIFIFVITMFSRLYFVYCILGFMDMLIDFRKLDPYRMHKK